MKNLNSVISLAYDKRKQIGKKIKIHPNFLYDGEENKTTIKEIGVVPWGDQQRRMYLFTLYDLPSSTPFRIRMQTALDRVVIYFKDSQLSLDLRVIYFTEAKSTSLYSSDMHLMFQEKEFELVA